MLTRGAIPGPPMGSFAPPAGCGSGLRSGVLGRAGTVRSVHRTSLGPAFPNWGVVLPGFMWDRCPLGNCRGVLSCPSDFRTCCPGFVQVCSWGFARLATARRACSGRGCRAFSAARRRGRIPGEVFPVSSSSALRPCLRCGVSKSSGVSRCFSEEPCAGPGTGVFQRRGVRGACSDERSGAAGPERASGRMGHPWDGCPLAFVQPGSQGPYRRRGSGRVRGDVRSRAVLGALLG